MTSVEDSIIDIFREYSILAAIAVLERVFDEVSNVLKVLSFKCFESSKFQILKIRMRITNILYESTRVRTTNPKSPQNDS